MKHTISHKICIVLALVTAASLALASITGSTLAYLTDTDSVTNGFTFRQLGNPRTDRLSYYYQDSNGNYYQITGTNYQNVQTSFFENELICASGQNAKFVSPPNGFEVSYITYRTGQNGAQTRINAGDCFAQPASNNIYVNVYFAPVTYNIAYDFNGYEEEDITFSDPLQTTYTVYDMIRVPYDASIIAANSLVGTFEYNYRCERVLWIFGGDLIGTIQCEENVPGASVNGNTLLGWDDQNGIHHYYDNAGTNTSWSTELTLTGNQSGNNVYSTFAARTSGDLALMARWQYEVANNTNSLNSLRAAPKAAEVPEENDDETKEKTETSEDAANVEAAETGGEKKEKLREDESTTTE